MPASSGQEEPGLIVAPESQSRARRTADGWPSSRRFPFLRPRRLALQPSASPPHCPSRFESARRAPAEPVRRCRGWRRRTRRWSWTTPWATPASMRCLPRCPSPPTRPIATYRPCSICITKTHGHQYTEFSKLLARIFWIMVCRCRCSRWCLKGLDWRRWVGLWSI